VSVVTGVSSRTSRSIRVRGTCQAAASAYLLLEADLRLNQRERQDGVRSWGFLAQSSGSPMRIGLFLPLLQTTRDGV
jgi:hypothetical protein